MFRFSPVDKIEMIAESCNGLAAAVMLYSLRTIHQPLQDLQSFLDNLSST